MDETYKYEMVEAMRKYGGGFVKCLAECFAHADQFNLKRLEAAFPEYVEQYIAMAGIDRVKAAEHGFAPDRR
jgi:hypothetical protein